VFFAGIPANVPLMNNYCSSLDRTKKSCYATITPEEEILCDGTDQSLYLTWPRRQKGEQQQQQPQAPQHHNQLQELQHFVPPAYFTWPPKRARSYSFKSPNSNNSSRPCPEITNAHKFIAADHDDTDYESVQPKVFSPRHNSFKGTERTSRAIRSFFAETPDMTPRETNSAMKSSKRNEHSQRFKMTAVGGELYFDDVVKEFNKDSDPVGYVLDGRYRPMISVHSGRNRESLQTAKVVPNNQGGEGLLTFVESSGKKTTDNRSTTDIRRSVKRGFSFMPGEYSGLETYSHDQKANDCNSSIKGFDADATPLAISFYEQGAAASRLHLTSGMKHSVSFPVSSRSGMRSSASSQQKRVSFHSKTAEEKCFRPQDAVCEAWQSLNTGKNFHGDSQNVSPLSKLRRQTFSCQQNDRDVLGSASEEEKRSDRFDLVARGDYGLETQKQRKSNEWYQRTVPTIRDDLVPENAERQGSRNRSHESAYSSVSVRDRISLTDLSELTRISLDMKEESFTLQNIIESLRATTLAPVDDLLTNNYSKSQSSSKSDSSRNKSTIDYNNPRSNRIVNDSYVNNLPLNSSSKCDSFKNYYAAQPIRDQGAISNILKRPKDDEKNIPDNSRKDENVLDTRELILNSNRFSLLDKLTPKMPPTDQAQRNSVDKPVISPKPKYESRTTQNIKNVARQQIIPESKDLPMNDYISFAEATKTNEFNLSKVNHTTRTAKSANDYVQWDDFVANSKLSQQKTKTIENCDDYISWTNLTSHMSVDKSHLSGRSNQIKDNHRPVKYNTDSNEYVSLAEFAAIEADVPKWQERLTDLSRSSSGGGGSSTCTLTDLRDVTEGGGVIVRAADVMANMINAKRSRSSPSLTPVLLQKYCRLTTYDPSSMSCQKADLESSFQPGGDVFHLRRTSGVDSVDHYSVTSESADELMLFGQTNLAGAGCRSASGGQFSQSGDSFFDDRRASALISTEHCRSMSNSNSSGFGSLTIVYPNTGCNSPE